MPESSALRLGKDDLILDIPKASHGSEVVLSYLGRRFPAEFHLLIHFGIPPFAQFFLGGFFEICVLRFFRITPSPASPPIIPGVVGSAALQLAPFGQNLRDACALRARRAVGTGTHQVSRLGRAEDPRKIRIFWCFEGLTWFNHV